jgi:hypothetical protein
MSRQQKFEKKEKKLALTDWSKFSCKFAIFQKKIAKKERKDLSVLDLSFK